MVLDAWGGETAQIGPNATAFPHRQARFLAQEFVTFATVPDDATVITNRRWLTGVWRALRPSASGAAYVNYIDPELQGWAQAYYGGNLDRLVEVKHTYDPHDVFRFAQCVPTTLPGATTGRASRACRTGRTASSIALRFPGVRRAHRTSPATTCTRPGTRPSLR